MLRRMPEMAEGVPIYDLLCLAGGEAPPVRLERRRPVPGPATHDHVKAVVAAVVRAASHRTSRRLRTLYALVEDDDPESYGEELLDALAAAQAPAVQLRILGRRLATRGVHHGPVALGLLLLGAAGFGDEAGIVECLGADAAFTGAAAVAARRGAADPEEFLWRLARSVTGPARLACVRSLGETSRPDIRSWVLREGWEAANGTADVVAAAAAGGLDGALAPERVDDDLLEAAAGILTALTAPGAAPDLVDYQEAPAAVDAYLRHVSRRRTRANDFLAVESIRRFLVARGDRVAEEWGSARRADAIGRCAAVLAHDGWDQVLVAGLAVAAPGDFAVMAAAAEARGIDTFPYRIARLEAEPSGSSWRAAFENADQMRARRLAAVASRSLRSTAEDDAVSGAESAWAALDSLLDCLGRHPGVGGDVVMTGLGARSAAHRRAALRTLATWDKDRWPEDAPRAVAAAATADPDPGVRGLAGRLLA